MLVRTKWRFATIVHLPKLISITNFRFLWSRFICSKLFDWFVLLIQTNQQYLFIFLLFCFFIVSIFFLLLLEIIGNVIFFSKNWCCSFFYQLFPANYPTLHLFHQNAISFWTLGNRISWRVFTYFALIFDNVMSEVCMEVCDVFLFLIQRPLKFGIFYFCFILFRWVMFRIPKATMPANTSVPIAKLPKHIQNCTHASYECSQPCVDGYAFCLRHILEDPSAPYKQCSFVYNTNGRKCPNAAPKLDRRDVSWVL